MGLDRTVGKTTWFEKLYIKYSKRFEKINRQFCRKRIFFL